MTTDDKEVITFDTLGSYCWPAMPTEESLRRFGWRLWKYFESEEQDPFIEDHSLRWADKRRLDQLASPPACDSVTDEMQNTFGEWARDSRPSRWLHLVILPPGDRNGVVRSWADRYGHDVLAPPSREMISDRSAEMPLPSREASAHSGVLVVPRLEDWFLRHQDGMMHIRRLLEHLASVERHVLVGCNSWAWQFLDKVVHASRLMPVGLLPRAFDAQRLKDWLMELAADEGHADHVFRSTEDGMEITQSSYFAKLAARSLGIPWVAWQIWRRALHLGPGDDEENSQKFPDETTVWVSPVGDFELPQGDLNVVLLVLHALLIHGALTADELKRVTPRVDAANVLPSLLAMELVDQSDGRYHVVPAAYPEIRSELISAGFPKDVL